MSTISSQPPATMRMGLEWHGIEHAWLSMQRLLERFGWHVLLAALALYVLRHKYRAYAIRRHTQRTLAEANAPERVAILERERARIRATQQERLLATQLKPKVKATQSTKKQA